MQKLWIAMSCFASVSAFAITDWKIDFVCQKPVWTSGPTVANGQFDGRIETACDFQPNQGGTLSQLDTALQQQVLQESDKVHAGPTATTLQGLPASYYDVTSTQDMQGMEAVIRADVTLATDGQSRYVSAMKSKEIQASGLAKNLKAVEAGFDLRPNGSGGYHVVFYSTATVNKPNLVPTGTFKNKVMQGMEEEATTQPQEYIENFLKTL